MKNAEKLTLNIDVASLNRPGKLLGAYGGTDDIPEGRLIRKFMSAKQSSVIRQLLPESIQDALIGVNYSEIRLLRAHTHINDMAVMNIYQKTNGEVTTFWEGPIEDDPFITHDDGNGYKNVCHDKMTPADRFVAQSGDVWLLNVKTPHSVSKPYDVRPEAEHFTPTTGETRYVVQAYFSKPYEFIAAEFAKAGMVEAV